MQLVDPPVRAYDSRKGDGAFADKETRRVQTGYQDAVFVNITVVGAKGDGFVTVWGDGSMPDVSNVNYGAGDTIANSAWVPVANDGTIQVYCYRGCDILIDVQACSK